MAMGRLRCVTQDSHKPERVNLGLNVVVLSANAWSALIASGDGEVSEWIIR